MHACNAKLAYLLATFLFLSSLLWASDTNSLASARNFYLPELLQKHDYRPAKNSFLLRNLSQGQKSTILELSGSGSVRHIWSTWSVPESDSIVAPRRVRFRIFVDGQTTASLEGPFDELCRAAEQTGTAYVPLPAFNYKGAFNFYLPIYFKRGIRIEIEALAPIEEFYTQVDYRVTSREEDTSRLVAVQTSSGLVLKYIGYRSASFNSSTLAQGDSVLKQIQYRPNRDGELVIRGRGVIRQITFRGRNLDDLELRIYWDGETTPSVNAPLRYFFADFVNAAMESAGDQMTCYFQMPLHDTARIVLRSKSGRSGEVSLEYRIDRAAVADNTPYFHAQYAETRNSAGYAQYIALRTRGDGLFVGVNLFDTGHNHGGGDAALIDGGTSDPLVLHGICGEDYFSFAWHQTGTMTPLTGAPVHARRYRLHLENPYPFHDSIQFLFGTFAGLEPKSVAFWYQSRETPTDSEWIAPVISWNVLGPLGLATLIPQTVGDEQYQTTVPIKDSVLLDEHWQSTAMVFGFADLTYQFRHYVYTSNGTGYVPGDSRTTLVTYVQSPSERTIDVLMGQDDATEILVNGAMVASLPARAGFGPSRCRLLFRKGWNALQIVLSNDENTDWRWCGVSLAFKRSQADDLRFSSDARLQLLQ